ncbi:hypothetical protein [Stenotrophomonas maltophilia]|uniref:hypothetical protein n=1 Tax=Stenotrophomonas maltophilia TaxID=40324 RepID=UPI00117F1C21|nr:hypothetical protein [Stenotrophomonas maltophilia]
MRKMIAHKKALPESRAKRQQQERDGLCCFLFHHCHCNAKQVRQDNEERKEGKNQNESDGIERLPLSLPLTIRQRFKTLTRVRKDEIRKEHRDENEGPDERNQQRQKDNA